MLSLSMNAPCILLYECAAPEEWIAALDQGKRVGVDLGAEKKKIAVLCILHFNGCTPVLPLCSAHSSMLPLQILSLQDG